MKEHGAGECFDNFAKLFFLYYAKICLAGLWFHSFELLTCLVYDGNVYACAATASFWIGSLKLRVAILCSFYNLLWSLDSLLLCRSHLKLSMFHMYYSYLRPKSFATLWIANHWWVMSPVSNAFILFIQFVISQTSFWHISTKGWR